MELKTAYPIKLSSSLSYEENKLPIINMKKEGRYTIVTHKEKLRLDERIGGIFIVCLCTLLTLGISCAFKWQALLWNESTHGYRYPRIQLSNQLFIQRNTRELAKEFRDLQNIFRMVETYIPMLTLEDLCPLFYTVNEQLKKAKEILDEVQQKVSTDHTLKLIYYKTYTDLISRFQQQLNPTQPSWSTEDTRNAAQKIFAQDIAKLGKILALDNEKILDNLDEFFSLITKVYVNLNTEKDKHRVPPAWIAKAEKQKNEVGNAFVLRLDLFAPMEDKAVRKKILETFTCPISTCLIETPAYLQHTDGTFSNHAFEKEWIVKKDPVTQNNIYHGLPIVDGHYVSPVDRKPVRMIYEADTCFLNKLQSLRVQFPDE